jgi:hypothetical protein
MGKALASFHPENPRFIRQRCAAMRKEPIQLDLFIPHEYGYDFKVVVTNKWISGKKILMYHSGRAAQESVFGVLKSQSHMDYIAVRRLLGNQLAGGGYGA